MLELIEDGCVLWVHFIADHWHWKRVNMFMLWQTHCKFCLLRVCILSCS